MSTTTNRRSVLGEVADELRESVHDFVTSKSPEAEVRRLMEDPDGYDGAVWSQMADQLELQGITIPERFGGGGFSFDAQAVVFEEMGAMLMCTPYLSTALAAEAIVASGDEAAGDDYLPRICSGELRAALAVTESDGSWRRSGFATVAEPPVDGVARLTGAKSFVLDGHGADILVVAAQTVDGPGLFVVDGEAAGVQRVATATLDLTRRQAAVTFDQAEGRTIGAQGAAADVLQGIYRLGAAAIAMEQVGGALACLNMSVEYAKDRVQFGRPIGSFQAVKHKCAEMLRRAELARAMAYEAAVATAAESDDAALAVSAAKVYCSEAYAWVASENIQVHGGIGYTWEHPAHLYFRRATADSALFGSPRDHRATVLEALGV
jgi:alkylation response protein AidB-like acyl-CoA dehydrogenase